MTQFGLCLFRAVLGDGTSGASLISKFSDSLPVFGKSLCDSLAIVRGGLCDQNFEREHKDHAMLLRHDKARLIEIGVRLERWKRGNAPLGCGGHVPLRCVAAILYCELKVKRFCLFACNQHCTPLKVAPRSRKNPDTFHRNTKPTLKPNRSAEQRVNKTNQEFSISFVFKDVRHRSCR